MNLLSHFMLPTQASGAIVLDGTFLIAVGTLIICYLIYKNFKYHTNPQAVSVSNENTNVLREENMTNNTVKQDMSFAHHVKRENKNSTVNKNMLTDEEIVKNDKKELVFNHRQ